MSRENVEIVREQFEASNEGDFGRVMRDWSDDVELVVPPDAVDAGEFIGKEAVGRWFGDWFQSFEAGYRFKVEEARDVGDAVLVVVAHDGRGKASGASVQARMAYLYRVRDERIFRIEVYPRRVAAL